MRFRRIEGDHIGFWCPGCDSAHVISIGLGGWGRDESTLTVSPSILVYPHGDLIDDDRPPGPDNYTETPRCHSFIRNGRWEFLADCEHHLVGQTRELEDWPSYVI